MEKYKKSRRRKVKRILLFGLLVPFTTILVGYLITSVIILPVMSK